jgi:dynein heavy chain
MIHCVPLKHRTQVLFVPLPVLYVSANLKDEERKVKKDQFSPAGRDARAVRAGSARSSVLRFTGPYECPCYRYRARTDRYLVFIVNMRCTPDKGPAFWTLRGTALLCNTD